MFLVYIIQQQGTLKNIFLIIQTSTLKARLEDRELTILIKTLRNTMERV